MMQAQDNSTYDSKLPKTPNSLTLEGPKATHESSDVFFVTEAHKTTQAKITTDNAGVQIINLSSKTLTGKATEILSKAKIHAYPQQVNTPRIK